MAEIREKHKPKSAREDRALLVVEGLETSFTTDQGERRVLDDVNFTLAAGEVLGLVGESGSGKSVSSLSIMRLLDKNGRISRGRIWFNGEDLCALDEKALDRIRGHQMCMIFQDAMGALNPVFTVGSQIGESLRVHLGLNRREARAKTLALLRQVGLPRPSAVMKAYPHTLSGGMQQRVMIALALACEPCLLIADEPTTALDVTIQAQIMALLKCLRASNGMGLLLITHDIALIAEMADRVLVMYAGQIVEEANVFELFSHPAHPYTRALLRSVPSIEDAPGRRLESIRGTVPEHYQTIAACRFAERCDFVQPRCREEAQSLGELKTGQRVRCHRALAGELPQDWRVDA